MELPPVRSAEQSVRGAATALARNSGSKVEESTHAGQRAPAPLTTQAAQPEKLLRREASVDESVDETMTLGDLERLVEKSRRGVRQVVTQDMTEASDWDPSEGKPIVMSSGGASLVSRMLGKR